MNDLNNMNTELDQIKKEKANTEAEINIKQEEIERFAEQYENELKKILND